MKMTRLLMATLPPHSILVLGLGLTLPALAQSESPLSSTVMRLKGHARCSTDDGKTWRMLKVGDVVTPGTTVQTAQKADMDLLLGEEARPPAGAAVYDPEAHGVNLVSLDRDTLLRLDKLVKKQSAGKESGSEILLDLRTGSITGNVPKQPGGSKFEIRFLGGVATVKEGAYRLRSTGQLGVMKGAASIALGAGSVAKEIQAGQEYNPSTRQVGPMSEESSRAARSISPAPDERDRRLSRPLTPFPGPTSPLQRAPTAPRTRPN